MKLTTLLYLGLILLSTGLGIILVSQYIFLGQTTEAIGKILVILGVGIDTCVILPFVLPRCWCGEKPK
jgi:hypothetical protein